MRAVLYMFQMLETILNLYNMGNHIIGIVGIDFGKLITMSHILHYTNITIIYIFTSWTLFLSIQICTGFKPEIWHEIYCGCLGAFAYVSLAVMVMYNAEKHSYMLYLGGTEKVFQSGEPVFPFFEYERSRAIASLMCGIVYLLHAAIVIDVYLSTDEDEDEDYDVDEFDGFEHISQGDIVPIKLYVGGAHFHSKLEEYDWFRQFLVNGELTTINN